MTRQTSLLVSHKGVDLHAATAVRVMQQQLEGGDALRALHRCELHTYWADGDGRRVADLLEIGRYFNPNKHHYGHFEVESDQAAWSEAKTVGGGELPETWPGRAVASDLTPLPDDVATILLGGPIPNGCVAVDVATLSLGAPAALASGVVWRLVLADDGRDARRLATRLTVARGGNQGLLVNPHMHGWLSAVRRP